MSNWTPSQNMDVIPILQNIAYLHNVVNSCIFWEFCQHVVNVQFGPYCPILGL